MKFIWKKLGKIFDPTIVDLPLGCSEFAQSPQALVFKDFVRIYFSTRCVDPGNGKFLSHVAYVDMSHDLSKILALSKNQVVELGQLGCFDEHGIFPFSPFRDGPMVVSFTCGWSRRVSVSVETAIGFAWSDDGGETFRKLGNGPILSASMNEPVLVGDGFVTKYNGTYHLWYIFGTGWHLASENEPPARVYKIGHARSQDCIEWQRDDGIQIVPDRLKENECQALPTVLQLNGRWHMFFCFREATDFRNNPLRSYRLGYAWSDDLKNWTRDDSLAGISLSENGWDSEMMCYPNIFRCGDKVYLLYNGNEFGKHGFGAAELDQSCLNGLE